MTSRPVSRRRVVAGAAWTVPVVVVGAATPALAASPSCATQASFSTFSQSTVAYLNLVLHGANSGDMVAVTSVTGPGFGEVPAPHTINPDGTLQLLLARSTDAPATGNVTVIYEITNPNRPTCTGYSLTFLYNNTAPSTCPTQSSFSFISQATAVFLNLVLQGYIDEDDMLTVTSVSGPGFGAIPAPHTINADGTVQVTLARHTDAPATGNVTVTYEITNPTRPTCRGYSVTFLYTNTTPSTCPTQGSFTVLSQATAVHLSLNLHGYIDEDDMLRVTSVSGPGFGTLPAPLKINPDGKVQVTLSRNTDAPATGTITVTYEITNPTRPTCTGYSVTFPYSNPAPAAG
jgi:hypothetical protein